MVHIRLLDTLVSFDQSYFLSAIIIPQKGKTTQCEETLAFVSVR